MPIDGTCDLQILSSILKCELVIALQLVEGHQGQMMYSLSLCALVSVVVGGLLARSVQRLRVPAVPSPVIHSALPPPFKITYCSQIYDDPFSKLII